MNWLSRLSDFLRFEYRYEGTAEKDGRLFKKYAKIERFRSRHRRAAVVLFFLILLAPLVYWIVSRSMGLFEDFSSEAEASAASSSAE